MDNNLYHQLNKYVKPSVQKKDFDCVLAIDGEEGCGKSVFSFQLAKILDPNFKLSQIAFTPNEFTKAITEAKPFQCIIFDEAFFGLSARASLSEVNQLLISLMMEMRQKNLFVILVMPTYYMLDKYCVLHRCKGLFHVYLREGKRGFWVYYNRRRMKHLYLIGKKTYTYNLVKYLFFGRFMDQYTVNEMAYKERKRQSLTQKRRTTKDDTHIWQRDVLFNIIYEDYEPNHQKIADKCKNRGYSIDRSTVSKILSKKINLEGVNDQKMPQNEGTVS